MAAKKPSSKATKARKTVARKADSPRKATHAKKAAPAVRGKSAASARPARPAPKLKLVAKAAPAKPPKASAATDAPKSTAKAQAKAQTRTPPLKPPSKPQVKPAVTPAPAPPIKPIPARSVTQPQIEADSSADEDAEAEAPSRNLLAGPRNVKPYIARRGEQYMGKEQLEHFRRILNNWKRDLMEEVDRTVLHMKDEAANFPDPNDRATQESEFSLELRTRDRERKLIRKIEEAIKRTEDGSYGYCVETGEEIGIKRLEARPVATLCIEAQERRERREKQYGDRDDRYR